MTVRALHNLGFGDESYRPGDIFEAAPDDAEALIDQKLVEPFAVESPDN